MKKYIAIATLALLAGAACSKVDTVDSSAPAKIGFEVATYVPENQATKAIDDEKNTTFPVGGGGSLFGESLTTVQFYANGFFYPASGTAGQNYMTNVIIKPNGASSAVTSVWAPDSDYYWPKSGYINFVSYASEDNSISFTAKALDTKKVKLTIAEKAIDASDNILIADAVFNANKDNCSGSTMDVTGEATNGVPTLFRHALAKLKITFNLKTETAKKTTKTTYVVEVTDAKIECATSGSLELVNDGSLLGDNLVIQRWFNTGDVNWTTTASAGIVCSKPTVTLTNNTDTGNGADGNILAERSVLPQELGTSVKLILKYTVKAKHDSTDYSEEKFEVTKELSTASITKWGANQKFTYNITLDPVTNTVSFDPAVQNWEAGGSANISL